MSNFLTMLLAYQKEFNFCRTWEDLGRLTLDQVLFMSYAYRKLNEVPGDKSQPVDLQPAETDRATNLLNLIPPTMRPMQTSPSARMVVMEDADETMALVDEIRARRHPRSA